MNRFYRGVWFVVLILQTIHGQSQNSYAKHYSVEDGLASNTAYFVFQDKEGFIWVGTDQGLNRFNGLKFDHYAIEDGLTDLDLLNYFYDSKGRLWFQTFNGIPGYYQNGRFYGPTNSPMLEGVQLNNYISAMAEDSNGKLYISSSFGDLISFDVNDSVTNVYAKESKRPTRITDLWIKENRLFVSAKGLSIVDPISMQAIETQIPGDQLNHHIESLFLDSMVLISSRNKIFLLDDAYHWFETVKLPEDHEIYFLGSYNHNSLFVGTNKGLLEFDVSKREIKILSRTDFPVTHAIEDTQNGILFSTLGAGIYYIPDTLIRKMTTEKERTPMVSSVKNLNGEIWFGKPNLSYGKWLKEGVVNHQLISPETSIPKDLKVLDFIPIEEELFIKLEKIAYQLKGTTELLPLKNGIGINCTAYDSYGDLWVAGIHGALPVSEFVKKADTKNLLIDINFPIQSISFSTQNETAYLGTNDGLFGYVLASNEIDSAYSETRSRKVVGAIGIHQDSLLVITANDGFYLYEGKKLLRHYDKSSNSIPEGTFKIIQKNDHEHWCVLHNALIRISSDGQGLKVDVFNTSNGLPETTLYDLAFQGDQMFLATEIGLLKLPVDHFNKRPISPKIAELLIKKDSTIFYDKRSFHLTENEPFELNWKVVSYGAKGISYQYRLDKGNWLNSSASALSFSSLPIGKHELEIRAKTGVSEWSEIRNIIVIVSGKWWNSSWFKWSSLCLFILGVGLLFQFNVIKFNTAKIYGWIEQLSHSIASKQELTIKTHNGIEKINTTQINWIRSDGNYCHIALAGRTVMVLSTLKSFEEQLKGYPSFMRVHRSYLVNLKAIKTAKSTSLRIDELEIPVGDTYRKQYQSFFKNFQSSKA